MKRFRFKQDIKRLQLPLKWLGLVTLVSVLIGAGFLSLRLLADRAARQNFDQGHNAVASRILTPWFKLGLLDNDSTHLLMAALLRTRVDPKTALEAADDCLLRTKDLDCAVGVGVAYYQMNLLDEAEAALLPVVTQPVPSAEAHFYLGEIARRNKRVDFAIAEYATAVGYAKNDPSKRFFAQKAVEMLNENHRYADATPFLETLVTLSDSDSPGGLYVAAEAYLGMKKDVQFAGVMSTAEKFREKSKLGSYYILNHPQLYDAYRVMNHGN